MVLGCPCCQLHHLKSMRDGEDPDSPGARPKSYFGKSHPSQALNITLNPIQLQLCMQEEQVVAGKWN